MSTAKMQMNPKYSHDNQNFHHYRKEKNSVCRVAVFLDGCNFFYLQKDILRWFVDPKKLLGWLSKYGEITDANYYTTVDTYNEGQNNYLRALGHMGFRVEAKPINKEDDDFADNGQSVDLDMIIDILTQIDNYDMAVIISGNSDFARIVEVLRTRGKDFLVMGTKGTMSSDLRSVSGLHYKDFADIRKDIEKF